MHLISGKGNWKQEEVWGVRICTVHPLGILTGKDIKPSSTAALSLAYIIIYRGVSFHRDETSSLCSGVHLGQQQPVLTLSDAPAGS